MRKPIPDAPGSVAARTRTFLLQTFVRSLSAPLAALVVTAGCSGVEAPPSASEKKNDAVALAGNEPPPAVEESLAAEVFRLSEQLATEAVSPPGEVPGDVRRDNLLIDETLENIAEWDDPAIDPPGDRLAASRDGASSKTGQTGDALELEEESRVGRNFSDAAEAPAEAPTESPRGGAGPDDDVPAPEPDGP